MPMSQSHMTCKQSICQFTENKIITEVMELQESKVILQQEKNSNPIFRIIFNKLKFLRGKLAQIDHIRTLDQKSLKPAQLNKLHKLPQIQQEIQKNEDFAKYYKSILIEHNLSDRKVDDLLKISTLFTVGRRMQTQQYCPKELKELYERFNNSIFGSGGGVTGEQLSDEVVRVYELLWDYLEDDAYYNHCRDYMTYLQEIDLRKSQEGTNLPHIETFTISKYCQVQRKSMTLSSQLISQVNQRLERLQLSSEVFRIHLSSDLIISTPKIAYETHEDQPIFSRSEKDIDYKEECSTTNPEGESQNKDLDREPLDAITHPEVVWIKKNQSFEGDEQCRADIIDEIPHDRQTQKKKRHRKAKKTVFAEMDCIRKGSEAAQDNTQERSRVKVKYIEKKNA